MPNKHKSTSIMVKPRTTKMLFMSSKDALPRTCCALLLLVAVANCETSQQVEQSDTSGPNKLPKLSLGRPQASSSTFPSRQQAASSVQNDEEPIVISSGHSGRRAPIRNRLSPLGPHTSGLAGGRLPVEFNQPFQSSSNHRAPTPSPPQQDDKQEARSGFVGSFANQSQVQQPSQEFESPALGTRIGGSLHAPSQLTRWPPSSMRPQDSLPSGQQLALSSAPYAVSQQQQAASWTEFGAQSSVSGSSSSLIRDTSDLAQQSGSLLTSSSLDDAQRQQHQPTMWMQSVRDNHHGPLRSRFNLTYLQLQQQRDHQDDRPPAHGNALMLDGHMRAKGSHMSQSPYEQQAAKSVRNEQHANSLADSITHSPTPDAEATESSQSLWSRRNSKFTKQEGELERDTTPGTTNLTLAPMYDLVHGSENNTAGEAPVEAHGEKAEASEAPEPNKDLSSKSDAAQVLLNNNHSGEKRGPSSPITSNKSGRSLFANTDREDRAESRVNAPNQGSRQGAQVEGTRSWSRLLPALLQRTLGSVFRRLTGAQQAAPSTLNPQQRPQNPQLAQRQPQPGPLSSIDAASPLMQFGGPAFGATGINYLASALSTVGGESRPVKPSALDQLQPELLGGMKQQAANSMVHETRQPLRQHANKKIIDSAIDLPASERRQTLERRAGTSDEANIRPKNSTEIVREQLKIGSGDRKKRRAKTLSDWSKDAADYDENSESVSSESDGSEGGDEKSAQMDFRTTTEQPIGEATEQGDDYEEESSASAGDGETLSLAGTIDAAQYYRVVPDQSSEPELSPGLTLMPDGEDATELSEPGIDQGQEPDGHLFLYSPNPAFSLRRAVDEPDGAATLRRRPSQAVNKRAQLHSNEQPSSDSGIDLALEMEPLRRRPTRRRPGVKRRRPSTKPLSAVQSSEVLQPIQVPPISIQNVKPAMTDSWQTSASPKPVSVFIKPPSTSTSETEVDGEKGKKGLLSPMSSSINVMDLDPSMTQLAHNKLIVAKYKPKRFKGKGQQAVPSAAFSRRPNPSQASESNVGQSSNLVRKPNIALATPPKVNIQSTAKPVAIGAQKTPVSSQSANLAPSLSASQVMTNNHINEIINRWTRPLQLLRPQIEARVPLENSSQEKPQAAGDEGLRIISELQSSLAAGLAARFSPPTKRPTQPSSGASSQRPGDQYAQAWSSGQYTTVPPMNPQAPSKNEKFNFSLISMNNRERINPLLFPIERPLPNNTSTAKKPANQRVRFTTSTTTTSTTTTSTTSAPLVSTTTTKRPQRTRRPAPPVTDAGQRNGSHAAAAAPDDDIGQIVRNQHHTKPHIRHKLTESERLRNQYLSLIGHNASLDGRAGAVTDQHLSGHITMVTSSLLNQDSSRGSVASQSSAGTQEAAHDANKYVTILDSDPNSADTSSDHSIVIMNDNHHQTGRRRPPAMGTIQPSLNSAEPIAVSNAHQANPSLIVRKYIEEFVNGSRIRPSSAAKLGQTSDSIGQQAEPEQPAFNTTRNSHAPPPATMLANHHSAAPNLRQQQKQAQQAPSRRYGVAAPESKQQIEAKLRDHQPAFSFAKASPVGLAGKLDEQTQGLLQSIFDRDASYSNSLLQLHEEYQTARANKSTGEIKRRVSEVEHSNAGDNPTTTTTYEFVPHYTLTDAVYSTSLNQSLSPVHLGTDNADSGDYALKARFSPSSTLTPDRGEPSQARGNVDQEASDLSNRVSMRKNQAMIQSILKAIAKRNNQTLATTTSIDESSTAEPTMSSVQQDLGAYSYSIGTTTQASSPASSRLTHPPTTIGDELDQTPRPQATQTSTVRYATVETVSATRQKINRPTQDYSSSYLTASTPSMAQTTKLTESPSNDDNLRKTIKNRISTVNPIQVHQRLTTPMSLIHEPSSASTTPGPVNAPQTETSTAPETSDTQTTSYEHTRGPQSPEQLHQDQTDHDQTTETYAIHSSEDDGGDHQYPDLLDYTRPRPVIIRRRPRPTSKRPLTSGQIGLDLNQSLPTLVVTGGFSHQDRHPGSTRAPNKKRRKPSKKPSDQTTERPVNNHSLDAQAHESLISVTDPFQREKPNKPRPAAAKPGPSSPRPVGGLIRKRPGFIRLPPGGIRIHEYSPLRNQTTPQRRPPSSISVAPVSIILPMDSVIKRPDQDIRTRPLTIIDSSYDPFASSPSADSLNDSLTSPFGSITRIPETTIIHNKMVVTYKPGRPLPGASLGSFGASAHEYQHGAGNKRDPATESNQTTFNELVPSSLLGDLRPQLGSGNGGDTHLVSIEQQQAQQLQQALQTTPRPSTTTGSSGFDGYTDSGSSTEATSTMYSPTVSPSLATTTTPPSNPAYPAQVRPIIVINGLFGEPLSHSGQAPSSAEHNTSKHEHSARPQRHRPAGSQSGANSLIEASSMSVMAQAAHGHSTSANTTRPWTASQSITISNSRHNITSAANATSSNDSQDPLIGSSSSQSADHAAGSDSPASSSSWTSGPHIGMPFLGHGGSASSSSRPSSSQQSYKWRVRKRPNGNSGGASTNQHHDHSASASTQVNRPFGAQLFNANTLSTLLDGAKIFFARMRTFLISFMVMFLPPLALAASVANAMSS